jgi:hypothetical protein
MDDFIANFGPINRSLYRDKIAIYRDFSYPVKAIGSRLICDFFQNHDLSSLSRKIDD